MQAWQPQLAALLESEPIMPDMAGMRNKVIHGYDSVDFERVWGTVTVSIPALRAELGPLLSPEGDE